MAKPVTDKEQIADSNKAVDRLYSYTSLESESYEREIAKYQDKTSPSQVQDHSEITRISLRALDGFLKDAVEEINNPKKEGIKESKNNVSLEHRDNTNDGWVSTKDMRKIFEYSKGRLKEYEENYKELKSDPDKELNFHKRTIVNISSLIREAQNNAAEFVRDGKAGQIEVNNNPNTGNVLMAKTNSGLEDVKTDSVIPTATQAGTGTGNAANASSKAMALPDKSVEEKAEKKAEEPNRGKSALRSLMASMGFKSKAEQDNVEKTLREKGDANGGSISSQDVAATFKNVTGRDVNGMDPAELAKVAMLGDRLRNGGTVGDHPSDYLNKPKAPDQSAGLTTAYS